MADTKLTRARIPTRRPTLTHKKLGLLTPYKRRMVSLRLSQDTIELLSELIKSKKQKNYIGITKTDLIEAAILHISRMKEEEFARACQQLNLERDQAMHR